MTTISKPKIVIYTVNIKSYDKIVDPPVIEGCDYVCFTDAPSIQSNVWKRGQLLYHNKDPKRVSRHPKIKPHLYFPNYDISIYLDGNQTLKELPPAFLNALHTSVIGLFKHPKRNCNYKEAHACVGQRLEHRAVIRKQMDLYRAANHPINYGLWQAGFIIRKHNDPACVKLMNEWWDQVYHYSKRDQISLPYVLRKNNIVPGDLGEGKNINIYNHPAIAIRPHVGKPKLNKT